MEKDRDVYKRQAQCSKLKGAYQVIVVDVLEGKLDLAKSLGADVVVNSREEDPVAKVKALTGGRGADVVVEAAGTAESLSLIHISSWTGKTA